MAKPSELAKILCVDDEPKVLEALERVLRQDFKVFTASSGKEALELCNQHQDLAVVLSDYRMPGMTGIEFLETVKQLNPSTVRCIISGQIETPEISKAINQTQIHRLILKPWDNEYLRIQMLEAAQTHKTLQERNHLRVLAITDPVTGLTNHRFFQEELRARISEAQRHKQKISVIMLDVDHFKEFNDKFGHPEGDRLLAEFAKRIQEFSPPEATISRYGGEEFAFILPEQTAQQASTFADDLRRLIENEAFNGSLKKPRYVTVSLGVSSFPEHGDTPARLVAAADQALYQAKRLGRNQSVVALVED